jgi:hypothetical protein
MSPLFSSIDDELINRSSETSWSLLTSTTITMEKIFLPLTLGLTGRNGSLLGLLSSDHLFDRGTLVRWSVWDVKQLKSSKEKN